MTIQLLQPFNGLKPGIYSNLGAVEEARLVALPGGMARYYTDGMDGKNPVLSVAEQAAAQALVSTPGNQPSATLAATVGTPGQIVRLSDGDDLGAILVWAIPAGASAYAWCYWLSPADAY